MENIFTISGKLCKVTLDKTGLTWRVQDSIQGEFHAPAAEIISCWSCPKGSLKCCPLPEVSTYTCPQNDGLASDDENKFSTSSATSTSSIYGGDSGVHYGATETNSDSLCQSDSAVNTDHQTSMETKSPPTSTSLNSQGEKLDESSRPEDRLAGLPFRHCMHSHKLNTTPALAVEICERVLPSALLRDCLRGDGERMVTTWKPRVLVLRHEDTNTVKAWLTALWEVVAANTSRPRHLLVIVNPMSGNKTSEKRYNARVAPLFRRAAIRVTLKKTTHSGHAEELAEKAAMEGDVDGVVTVSGDGTFAEAVAGLVKAAARQRGVSIHHANSALPKSGVAASLIPSGSTNGHTVSCHGTEDIATSVLQIIMGSRRYVHLAGMYADDRLLHVCSVTVHGAYLGGLVERSCELRHLGPSRNILAGIKEFFSRRSHEGEIRYLVEENVEDLLQLDGPECRANCVTCQAPSREASAGQSQGEWRQLKCEYDWLTINLVTSECRYSRYGLSPKCHANNGYCDVIIIPKMSRLRFILKLFRLQSTRDHITKAPTVAFRTSELHYRSLTQASPLGCDGELRYYPEFVFKVHRDCLPVYSRGREPLSTLDLSTLTNYFK